MTSDPQVVSIPQQQYPSQVRKSNVLAVVGLILAVLGALGSLVPFVNIFGDVLALLGLIFGIIALVQSRSKGAGKGMSIAAIIVAVAAFPISVAIDVVAARVLDPSTPAAVTGKIGQPVRDGKFTFVVRSVRCGLSTYGGSLPAVPHSQFCAVSLAITNDGAKPQMFNALQAKGFIAGRKYQADVNASGKANANSFLNNISVNPAGSATAIVLIDVPAGKQLELVELHDSILSRGTSVSLR